MRVRTLIALVLLVGLPSGAASQTTYTLMPYAQRQFTDNDGEPCAGCLLDAYSAGTSTRVDTYSDNSGTVNANPVVLDGNGRATVYLSPGSYKFVLRSASGGTTYWSQDNVPSTPPFFVDLDITGTAGEALTAGQVVYLSAGSGGGTAGRWYKTDADNGYSSTTAGMVGMVPFDCTSGETDCAIRLQGRATGLSSLTPGTTYYASATAGALTSSAPANARTIGIADSSTTLVLAPNQQQPSGNFSVGGNLTVGGTLGVTGAITATAGQVLFPASQNAAAGANTLDDYEEGTWTPVIGGSGGTSGQAYTNQEGRYLKIGSLVWASAFVTLSTKGTITANVQIQGLPFTAETGTLQHYPCSIAWLNTVSSFVNVTASVAQNTTTANVFGITAGATSSETNLVTGDLGNTSAFKVSCLYRAAN